MSAQAGHARGSPEEKLVKVKVFAVAAVIVVVGALLVAPSGIRFYADICSRTGYFGPISSRVRGLFLQHTRTGNPLVDSVAEHQPGTHKDYERMLLNVYGLIPIGVVMALLNVAKYWQSSFLLLYTIVAFYFATKMSRLMLLLSPVGSSLGTF